MTTELAPRTRLTLHPAGHILGLVRRHVLHQLERLLPDQRNTVMVVGIVAQGTRAHDLVDGAKALKMFGEYLPVRARIADVRHSRPTRTLPGSSTGCAACPPRAPPGQRVCPEPRP
ncbi:hypothetical protein ACFY3M_48930 [Streptomyces mirabilis]|uniref:hypothetical protein n=1 Tax=Streptomyces mirabilis TaxID=68239 RepID=UPI0036B0C798